MKKRDVLKTAIALAKPHIANNHALQLLELAGDTIDELAGEISALRGQVDILWREHLYGNRDRKA